MQFKNSYWVCANINTSLMGNSVTISEHVYLCMWIVRVEGGNDDGRLLVQHDCATQSHAP